MTAWGHVATRAALVGVVAWLVTAISDAVLLGGTPLAESDRSPAVAGRAALADRDGADRGVADLSRGPLIAPGTRARHRACSSRSSASTSSWSGSRPWPSTCSRRPRCSAHSHRDLLGRGDCRVPAGARGRRPPVRRDGSLRRSWRLGAALERLGLDLARRLLRALLSGALSHRRLADLAGDSALLRESAPRR